MAKQDWGRVSSEAKAKKQRNRKHKRDLERESRIKEHGGEPIIIGDEGISQEVREERIKLEHTLRNPKKPRGEKYIPERQKGPERSEKEFLRTTIGSIKRRCRLKNIEFNLKAEDFVVPKVCPILGIPLKWGHKITNNTPSVDRIDPTKGYTKDNVKIISMRANRLKNNATLEELEKIYLYVKEHIDKNQGF